MPCTVEPSDSVAHARALVDDRPIKNPPMMSNRRLVGIFSAHDLEGRSISISRSTFAKPLKAHSDRVKINSATMTKLRTVAASDSLA
jgi:CBS-domain-containing membrane protein